MKFLFFLFSFVFLNSLQKDELKPRKYFTLQVKSYLENKRKLPYIKFYKNTLHELLLCLTKFQHVNYKNTNIFRSFYEYLGKPLEKEFINLIWRSKNAYFSLINFTKILGFDFQNFVLVSTFFFTFGSIFSCGWIWCASVVLFLYDIITNGIPLFCNVRSLYNATCDIYNVFIEFLKL